MEKKIRKEQINKLRKSFKSLKSLKSLEIMKVLEGSNENVLYINFEIKVQDFGCGISQENVEKLFIDFSKMEESAS